MVRRGVQLLLLAAVTIFVTYVSWPRPAVDIRIARGGVASIHQRFGRTTALPETIVVAAGGRPRVRIINRDTIAHALGLFSVQPEREVSYSLPQPGTYTGACSAHPSSQTLTFVVR